MNFSDENIIKKIAREAAETNGFFLIEFIMRGTPRKRVIEVFIDGKEDVSAEVCASVSRQISSELNELLKENDDYKMVVSSPGIDRPLLFLDQYQKHIGRKMELTVEEDGKKKKVIGKLKKIINSNLFFEKDNKEQIINFINIKKAKVLISFSPKG